jgi:hypothetical protein
MMDVICLALSCDLSQSDIYTNRVQIFWFEDGDVRRAVVGFPKMHHWFSNELGPVANPIRYNPKDGTIYQLSPGWTIFTVFTVSG